MGTQVHRLGYFDTPGNQPRCEPPTRKAPFGQSAECQIIRDPFARLGDKWSFLIDRIRTEGSFRFGELNWIVVVISQLTLTRRILERDSLAW